MHIYEQFLCCATQLCERLFFLCSAESIEKKKYAHCTNSIRSTICSNWMWLFKRNSRFDLHCMQLIATNRLNIYIWRQQMTLPKRVTNRNLDLFGPLDNIKCFNQTDKHDELLHMNLKSLVLIICARCMMIILCQIWALAEFWIDLPWSPHLKPSSFEEIIYRKTSYIPEWKYVCLLS